MAHAILKTISVPAAGLTFVSTKVSKTICDAKLGILPQTVASHHP
jgi:hypothetical protein